jgi:hypothetical protein
MDSRGLKKLPRLITQMCPLPAYLGALGSARGGLIKQAVTAGKFVKLYMFFKCTASPV